MIQRSGEVAIHMLENVCQIRYRYPDKYIEGGVGKVIQF